MALGFKQAGFHVMAAVDNNENALTVYRRNFGTRGVVSADLGCLRGSELRQAAAMGDRRVDVVFGGPPCQGFSYGGKHDLADPRNGLILTFARLVGDLQPSYFVMENVKGLLCPDYAEILGMFLGEVNIAGYDVIEPIRVLNAKDYGVPQDRARVFIVGKHRDSPPVAYPDPVGTTPSVWDAISDLAIVDNAPRRGDEYVGPLGAASGYAERLRTGAGPDGTFRLTGFLPTIHRTEIVQRFRRIPQGEREPVSRFHRLEEIGLAPTLRSGTGPENGSFMAPRPIHPRYPRCIYTREAARLHSFPDWFVFHGTKWHDFRVIGNSVPPALAYAVATQIAGAVRLAAS